MTTVSSTPGDADEQRPFSPLVADVISSMFARSAATTNTLLDLRQAMIDDLEAERYAVQHGIDQLLAGPWMPTPDAIRDAVFYPRKDLIDEYKARKEADR